MKTLKIIVAGIGTALVFFAFPVVFGIGGNLGGLIGIVIVPVGLIVGVGVALIYFLVDHTPKKPGGTTEV